MNILEKIFNLNGCSSDSDDENRCANNCKCPPDHDLDFGGKGKVYFVVKDKNGERYEVIVGTTRPLARSASGETLTFINYQKQIEIDNSSTEDHKILGLWKKVDKKEDIGLCHPAYQRVEYGVPDSFNIVQWGKKLEFGELTLSLEYREDLD